MPASARYPASLTKMMTLYLVFERLASGKIKKSTQVPFSAHAAAQPPTKLGVKVGKSVSVETIIYSLVTKSANNSAAAIAEYLGGSENGFARMMTAKAKKLGMTGTLFQNASGLPDPDQHSTARDLAVLGLALREHFPQYYGYFSTRSFTYGRQRMANHNRLLGRVKGIDGIKTGYTRASGFNLVTSVGDGKRRIVAVVMGGQTGRARDNHMADLIKKYLPKASGRDGGDLIAKSKPEQDEAVAAAEAMTPKPVKPAKKAAAKAEDRGRHHRAAHRAGLRRTDAETQGAGRRRSDQHVIDRCGAVRLGNPGRLDAGPGTGQIDARQNRQAGIIDPRRCGRLYGAVRQGRRDLLPRPLRRLRLEVGGVERVRCAQEKEDRLLRGPRMRPATISRNLPEVFLVEGVQW